MSKMPHAKFAVNGWRHVEFVLCLLALFNAYCSYSHRIVVVVVDCRLSSYSPVSECFTVHNITAVRDVLTRCLGSDFIYVLRFFFIQAMPFSAFFFLHIYCMYEQCVCFCVRSCVCDSHNNFPQ